MASLTIKLPDDQTSEIEAVDERKDYNRVAEDVREAVGDKEEGNLVLRREVDEKVRRRVKEDKKGEAGGYTLEE